jgi:hypothetical protein
LRRVVWQKFTDVSEVHAASIIKVMSDYQTTRGNNPEDSRLCTHSLQKLHKTHANDTFTDIYNIVKIHVEVYVT